VQGAETQDRDEYGKRNGSGDDQGAAPTAEEQQNHEAGEAGGDDAFANDSLDGGAHENRLIEERRHDELRRQQGSDLREFLVDVRVHVERRGIAGLVDSDEHSALAVHAHDIDLRRESVGDIGDVVHVDGRAVLRFYRDVVDLVDGVRRTIHLDVVLGGAELRGAGGQDEILRADSVDDVHRRQALGLQCGDIHVDGDLALLAAVGPRHRCPGDGGHLATNEVGCVVEQLLLGEPLAFHADLQNGHVGSGVGDDEGRRDPGRHAAENGIRDGRKLGDGQADVRAGTEETLDDRTARRGLRLHVIDVHDHGGDGSFEAADDAVFHLLGGEARVDPGYADDRDVNRGQDVGRRALEDDGKEQKDGQRGHDEGVRTIESESYDPHKPKLAAKSPIGV
jgi:hypothetical protein